VNIITLKSQKFIEIFQNINKHLFKNKINDLSIYCLYSTFPFKTFDFNDEKTFEEHNLFPSCFLLFEEKIKLN
jgi:hypothetical protein